MVHNKQVLLQKKSINGKKCRSQKKNLEAAKNYMRGKGVMLSNRKLEHIRHCEECLQGLFLLQKTIDKVKDTSFFIKFLTLEGKLSYCDGVQYPKVTELLWDAEETGLTYEDVIKQEKIASQMILKKLEKIL